ncbi:MAG TPA: pectinesterase family protein [Proteiniphilum sp.]|nr:pectinesterase family protein [Proteiniphilum sp.]HPJ49505.1 pectinesterase family protein [Proteiniphilum sp.]HPR19933.1 pectinesterase family protein [Proteiniphilum sp.]
MKTMGMISLLLLLGCLYWQVAAQTVMIEGVPRDTSYTVHSSYIKEVKRFPFIRVASAEIPAGIKAIESIPYKSIGNRELTLSVYRPDNEAILPAVMMIHGGGWNSGSPDMQKALALQLARNGYVTFTVEYRLSPEALFPAGMEDLEEAAAWFIDHAAKFGANPASIAVSGCSAGGQLAALIGTRNREGRFRAVINIDGISTFVSPETVDRAEKARLSGEKTPVDALWLGGSYSQNPKHWEEASALYQLHEGSAPVCFINSSIPRFHHGRDEHIRLLDSLGIYNEVHTFDETPHTFWHFHPWHLTTVRLMSAFLEKIFQPAEPIDRRGFDWVVAQDGTGDFTTVQAAIDAVPDFRKQPTRILIRNGLYRERLIIPETKHDLTLVGEDKQRTILTWNNFASKLSPLGDAIGTSGSASCYISPDLFTAENITFANDAGPVGQAVAVIVRSDRARFINCRFLGFQDTLYTHKAGSRQYYQNCSIEGTVDFIFGSSTAWFEECDIYCKGNGYITAASTPQEQPFGYIFNRCHISGDTPSSFYLGRPWRPHARVLFMECDLGDVIRPEGWNNWGNPSNESTAFYGEFNNRGVGADTTQRVGWSHQLTRDDAAIVTKEGVLGSDFFGDF